MMFEIVWTVATMRSARADGVFRRQADVRNVGTRRFGSLVVVG